MCKMLERKCTDKAQRLCSSLESQLSTGMSGSDMWDKTVSLFTVRKTFVFHNGYTKSSRDALRLLRSPAEDVAPPCCQ
uniref:Si:ch73-21g5.7 n=1 Tax=Kryptolebias marmoratus TaxID=37003 RepID=A0A3Q3AYX7_KRYMA